MRANAAKVTTLIADDEAIARAGLRDLLRAFDWVEVVAEVASGSAAVEAMDALRPELAFLDIQMPGLLGTQAIQRATHRPSVIFTTAYAQHAVTAFELGALDYLLKPFGRDRLAAALARVRTAIGQSDAPTPLERMREAFGQGPVSRLFIRSGGGIVPVAVAAVSWFEARGDYVAAHVGPARHLLHVSLNRLEARLDPSRFVRVHRTHIVNLDFVRAFRRAGRGRIVAELADGTSLAVSRTRAQGLRDLAT